MQTLTLAELVGNEDAFPVLKNRDYFNHAGVSPMPRFVGDAVRDFLDHFQQHGFVGFDFNQTLQTTRQAAADAIGASDASDIALVANTSEAISLVALGLDLKPGDEVVINAGEYPANVYPWQEACNRAGATLVVVPETEIDGHVLVREQDLEAACNERTKLLAVSHVQWGTGQRTDLQRLGIFCRENDILFSVDAIQSCGVVPIDVEREHVDFLQAGGHKWMLGTMGCGILYVRRDRLPQLRPATVGWGSVVNPFRWEEIDYTLRPDAGRYEYGSPALASITAVGAGLGTLVGLGIDDVHQSVVTLCDRLIAQIEDKYVVATPTHASRSGFLCFQPKQGDAEHVYKTLSKEHDTELAFRCGRIRFAPHFYNTNEQVDRLAKRLMPM